MAAGGHLVLSHFLAAAFASWPSTTQTCCYVVLSVTRLLVCPLAACLPWLYSDGSTWYLCCRIPPLCKWSGASCTGPAPVANQTALIAYMSSAACALHGLGHMVVLLLHHAPNMSLCVTAHFIFKFDSEFDQVQSGFLRTDG